MDKHKNKHTVQELNE